MKKFFIIKIFIIIFSLLLVNHAKACERQGQGQTQRQNASANVIYSPHSEAEVNPDFPFPGRPDYGRIMPYYGDYGAKFFNFTWIAIFALKMNWDFNETKQIHGRVEVIVDNFVPPQYRWSVENIRIVKDTPRCYVPIGFVYSHSLSNETTSLDLLKAALKVAMLSGGNCFLPVQEGKESQIKSSGWGIGGFTTQGWLWDSGNKGNVMGGGTGYAQSQVAPKAKPFLQGWILYIPPEYQQ